MTDGNSFLLPKTPGVIEEVVTVKVSYWAYQLGLFPDVPYDALILRKSEDKGISKSILKLCDYSLKIPMYGNLKSLNVSVSTGIFIYEILRKRRF